MDANRRLRAGVTVLCALLFVACGSKSVKPVLPKGQIIALSDTLLSSGGTDTIRFGRMGSGETAVKPLLLCNNSQQPLVILSYTRTCGCTTFEFDSHPIMSHDTVAATLTFDSRGLEGWQFKLIEVQLAGASAPLKIYIDAEVE